MSCQAAIAKFPYYLDFYFTKGSFYSGKWHGSQKEFKAFVDETVKATEPRLGQSMSARLNWSAWDGAMFVNGQTDWSRMKKGFEKMTSDFPDNWNRNNFAKFACMAGDKSALREQLNLIGNKVAIDAWRDISFYQHCSQIAARK